MFRRISKKVVCHFGIPMRKIMNKNMIWNDTIFVRTWWLSNSFSNVVWAPNARIVVSPCKEALRWENTGLRAETIEFLFKILKTEIFNLHKNLKMFYSQNEYLTFEIAFFSWSLQNFWNSLQKMFYVRDDQTVK